MRITFLIWHPKYWNSRLGDEIFCVFFNFLPSCSKFCLRGFLTYIIQLCFKLHQVEGKIITDQYNTDIVFSLSLSIYLFLTHSLFLIWSVREKSQTQIHLKKNLPLVIYMKELNIFFFGSREFFIGNFLFFKDLFYKFLKY